MIQVLFVCLGNICRSPMAEAVFQKMVDDAGLGDRIRADSAGTGSWHVGDTAHEGTLAVLRRRNIPYDGRSRQVRSADFGNESTRYVVAMDGSNVRQLQKSFGTGTPIYKLLDFADATTVSDVPDPYYSGGFDYVYDLVEQGCAGLLQHICRQHDLQPQN